MRDEKDEWKVQSKSEKFTAEKHLDSSTLIYIVAWFTFATIAFFSRFAIAWIGFFIFSEEINVLFLTLILDGIILFLSLYVSHGLIFKRTNIRRVFPWLILVLLGGYGQFSDPDTIAIISGSNISSDYFKAMYVGSFGLFIFLSHKYFSSLTPARWISI